jgi:aerobic-type carbon monoxide dehydrogenase small subunit (CoxS/CutS family)
LKLRINGIDYEVDVEDDTPLLWVLRDHLGLTGTKFGCGIGVCGACTVLLNGVGVSSCSIPAAAAVGTEVTTIEGLPGADSHPVQGAWVEEQVPQCGYCQPGMIMATVALLSKVPRPSDAEIDAEITNLCRCGTYPRIRRAIHRAAKESSEADEERAEGAELG